MTISIPSADRSVAEDGIIAGRDRLCLGVGWDGELLEFVATSGSSSQGETLSGRAIDEGSSH